MPTIAAARIRVTTRLWRTSSRRPRSASTLPDRMGFPHVSFLGKDPVEHGPGGPAKQPAVDGVDDRPDSRSAGHDFARAIATVRVDRGEQFHSLEPAGSRTGGDDAPNARSKESRTPLGRHPTSQWRDRAGGGGPRRPLATDREKWLRRDPGAGAALRRIGTLGAGGTLFRAVVLARLARSFGGSAGPVVGRARPGQLGGVLVLPAADAATFGSFQGSAGSSSVRAGCPGGGAAGARPQGADRVGQFLIGRDCEAASRVPDGRRGLIAAVAERTGGGLQRAFRLGDRPDERAVDRETDSENLRRAWRHVDADGERGAGPGTRRTL